MQLWDLRLRQAVSMYNMFWGGQVERIPTG